MSRPFEPDPDCTGVGKCLMIFFSNKRIEPHTFWYEVFFICASKGEAYHVE